MSSLLDALVPIAQAGYVEPLIRALQGDSWLERYARIVPWELRVLFAAAIGIWLYASWDILTSLHFGWILVSLGGLIVIIAAVRS